MVSKLVVSRQKSSEKVTAAAKTHKTLIADNMAAMFGADIKPAVELLLDKAVAGLSGRTAAMVAADDAHIAELGDDPAARAARDDAAEGVNAFLVDSRSKLRVLFGDDFVAKLGFAGATPSDPVALSRLGRYVEKQLAEVAPPASSIPGYVFKAEHWTHQIDEKLDQLDAGLAQVAKEEKEAAFTLKAKNTAILAYDKVFSCTAKLISAMLELSGEKELASKVRPSARRPGTVADPTEPSDVPA